MFEKLQTAKTVYKDYVITVINTGLLSENEINLFNYYLVKIEFLEETVTSTLNLYKETIIASIFYNITVFYGRFGINLNRFFVKIRISKHIRT